MKIIVGLGNPGKQYKKTPHNVGFILMENIVKNAKFKVQNDNFPRILSGQVKFKIEKKFNSEIVEGKIGEERVIVIKPLTFMNLSGEAIFKFMSLYKDRVSVSDLIVIHDDSDLDLGRIKIQRGGGSAGHHGIESILKSIGSDDFIRIRIGIRNKTFGKAMDIVLRSFNTDEEKTFEQVINRASEAVFLILTEGIEKAMNKYNIK